MTDRQIDLAALDRRSWRDRESPSAPGYTVWLIPAGVIVATVLAILCGALWR